MDSTGPDRAIMRRELIRAANVNYTFSAEQVSDLVRYATKTFSANIVGHPSFPLGVINSWAASTDTDLGKYAVS